MRFHDLYAALIDLLLPAECAGCGRPESPWCPPCRAALGTPRLVELPGGPAVLTAGRYADPLRTALLRYKERGRRDLAPALAAPLSELLTGLLPGPPRRPPDRPPDHPGEGSPNGVGEDVRTPWERSTGPIWLVPAPSRRPAARARGGDHVLRLCRILAEQHSDVRVAAPLRLDRSVRDSVGLDAAQRAANLAGRITVDETRLPPARDPVLLVDDVVTTGATLRTCRLALAEKGISVGMALTLCDATTTGR